jgi:hypothetical protein
LHFGLNSNKRYKVKKSAKSVDKIRETGVTKETNPYSDFEDLKNDNQQTNEFDFDVTIDDIIQNLLYKN